MTQGRWWDPMDDTGKGYQWSTPTSAAFLTAIIVLALILAELLAAVIDLDAM